MRRLRNRPYFDSQDNILLTYWIQLKVKWHSIMRFLTKNPILKPLKIRKLINLQKPQNCVFTCRFLPEQWQNLQFRTPCSTGGGCLGMRCPQHTYTSFVSFFFFFFFPDGGFVKTPNKIDEIFFQNLPASISEESKDATANYHLTKINFSSASGE